MKINLELSAIELSHVLKSGSLETFIDDCNGAEKDLNVIMTPKKEETKAAKADKPKANKPDPKVENLPDPKSEEGKEIADQIGTTDPDDDGSEVSLEEVRAKLAELMKKGKKAEVADLLKEFDAQKLTDVEESDYAALIEKANKI